MAELRALFAESSVVALGAGGLVIGMIYGAVAQRTGFCTLGAVSDWTLFGDLRRMRSWLLAIAVALAGTQMLFAAGVVDLNQSLYRTGPLLAGGHVLGGLMFGFGMVLAGGCVSRNLVRAGSGDLRALLVVIVVSLAVAVTLGGVLGPLRVWFSIVTSAPGVPGPAAPIGLWAGCAFAAVIAAACLSSRGFRASQPHWLAGLAVGLCVVAGWACTGLAFDEFADTPTPAQSLTFVKPAADAVEWLKRSTALGAPGFAIMTVAGTLLGSLSAALWSGSFAVATFADQRDTVRQLCGAVLMGVGGVLALGCSIGQGITGLSTLSPGSALAFVAIVVGAVAALKASERYSIFT